MASPLELIKDGVVKGDWKKVVQGYNRMSGEKLKVPAGKASGRAVTAADVPAAVRADIERPLLEAMREAVSRLEDAIDSDGITPASGAEEDEDEDEEERPLPVVDEPPRPRVRTEQERALLRGEDFTHVHAGTPEQDVDPEKGRACRVEPFRPGMKNQFVDDGTLARRDRKFDRKVLRGLRPTPRRPPARKVPVACFKCEKTFKVDPSLAPRTLGKGGEADRTSFVCDGCGKKEG